jgi:cysteine-rich repeat protein
MRKSCALVSLVLFSWIAALGHDARAGVTIDVLFQDATVPSGITIVPGEAGPGCVFTGYYRRSVSTGRCTDVVLKSTDDLVGFGVSVAYDSDKGLELVSMYEWRGVGVSFGKGLPQPLVQSCAPEGGLSDNGGVLQSFDCSIPEPTNPPVLAAGTYKVGTIIWDASCLTWSESGVSAVVSAYIDDSVDAVTAVRNGNIVDVSDEVVVGTHILSILGGWDPCGDGCIAPFEACDDAGTTPGDGCDVDCHIESGWTCEGEPSVCTEESTPVPSVGATGVAVLGVAVFGIGLVGLVIAARRRRA